MLSPEEYTIGWICALDIEFIAARALFDTTHDPPDIPEVDSNVYAFGEMSGHNIVLATLPKFEFGPAPVALTAADMCQTFINIRVGLLVGIGSGAPTQKHDIRLGDVVVSCGRGDVAPVIPCDFGEDGEAHIIGHLNNPPQLLMKAVDNLQAKFRVEGHDHLEQAIRTALFGNSRMQKYYRRPHTSTDVLYRSDFMASSSSSNDADYDSMVVERQARLPDESFMVHYGPIISMNCVIKDPARRDYLSEHFGALCFEMDAAGLMNSFPCLVVRGICNYADSHRYKMWQGYAAMAAAAYAKELLAQISPSDQELEEDNRFMEEWKITGMIGSGQASRHQYEQISASGTDATGITVLVNPLLTKDPKLASFKFTRSLELDSSRGVAMEDQDDSTSADEEAAEVFADMALQPHNKRRAKIADSFWESMAKFRENDFFPGSRHPGIGEWTSDVSDRKRRVRIAVIDTGVNRLDTLIKQQLERGRITGRSWTGDDPTDFNDTCGHGTHLVRLILKTNKTADILVAKVSENDKFSPESNISMAKASAIEWAADNNADVICLSWGFKRVIPVIKDALDKVIRPRNGNTPQRLVFAAAGNWGFIHGVAFPARERGVFCVHAVDGSGYDAQLSPKSGPNAKSYPIATVGVGIESQHMGKKVWLDGTSFATPIAAALAANVLEYAVREMNLDEHSWRKVSCFQGMRGILELMSMAGNRDDSGFLAPWRLRETESFNTREKMCDAIWDAILLG